MVALALRLGLRACLNGGWVSRYGIGGGAPGGLEHLAGGPPTTPLCGAGLRVKKGLRWASKLAPFVNVRHRPETACRTREDGGSTDGGFGVAGAVPVGALRRA